MTMTLNGLVFLFMVINGLIHTDVHTVKLGDTPVKIVKQQGKGKTFVHLHENETTALMAAQYYVNKEGGTLITLKHSGQRNIVFHLHKVKYEFDPNRIFTETGIKKTLQQYGHYSLAAHQEVSRFASAIKHLIPKGKVIAVHNNRDYSIREYFPKHPLARDAKAINYHPNSNYRNFYFVTQPREFERLKKLQFNVALQSPKAQDDGSLSYYLGTKNYINIESAYGQLSAQLKMLYHA
ncbi:protein-tyrosine phosphatase [Legionella taurinensis]|nr:protein-tyrosine phosphatase [Legionella taurinensis]